MPSDSLLGSITAKYKNTRKMPSLKFRLMDELYIRGLNKNKEAFIERNVANSKNKEAAYLKIKPDLDALDKDKLHVYFNVIDRGNFGLNKDMEHDLRFVVWKELETRYPGTTDMTIKAVSYTHLTLPTKA